MAEEQEDFWGGGGTAEKTDYRTLDSAWPEMLAQLIVVFSETMEREHSIDRAQADCQARSLAFALAKYFGGKQLYLPKGESLERALRDNAIWKEFDGKNIRELTKRYNLSHQQIRSIIKNQRALHIGKIQPPLPF